MDAQLGHPWWIRRSLVRRPFGQQVHRALVPAHACASVRVSGGGGSLSMMLNNVLGPGIANIPALYQQAGCTRHYP
eukprot:2629828-Amphidinium_carterae.1